MPNGLAKNNDQTKLSQQITTEDNNNNNKKEGEENELSSFTRLPMIDNFAIDRNNNNNKNKNKNK